MGYAQGRTSRCTRWTREPSQLFGCQSRWNGSLHRFLGQHAQGKSLSQSRFFDVVTYLSLSLRSGLNPILTLCKLDFVVVTLYPFLILLLFALRRPRTDNSPSLLFAVHILNQLFPSSTRISRKSETPSLSLHSSFLSTL